ncbi:MAG: polymer-forming cytoskeletal protein [Spirochaetales bacterium]|nr:polymer-forming cytoskeletal protein [Spirochaetales bacterium]
MKGKLFVIFIMFGVCCPQIFPLEIKVNSEALLREEGVYEDDYIFAGNELEFSGSATDLFFLGKTLRFKGGTESGLYAVGETVIIDGTVANDFFGGGRRIEVNGKITGTVFMGSGEASFSEDSVLDGSLFIAAGNVKLNGTVNGDVYAGSGLLYIDGTVNGNVTTGAGEIVIAENGRVNGDFEYSTENKLNADEEKRISGTITFEDADLLKDFRHSEAARFIMMISIVLSIMGFLSVLVFGLLLLLLPALRNFKHAENHRQFWYYLVWGLIPFFIYPMAVTVLMILVVTIPLGFIVLLAGFPLLLVTQVLGITAFGQYLFNLFGWNKPNRFLHFLFGFVFFVLIGIIPYVKIIGTIFFSCIGWGIILEKTFRTKFVKVEKTAEKA